MTDEAKTFGRVTRRCVIAGSSQYHERVEVYGGASARGSPSQVVPLLHLWHFVPLGALAPSLPLRIGLLFMSLQGGAPCSLSCYAARGSPCCNRGTGRRAMRLALELVCSLLLACSLRPGDAQPALSVVPSAAASSVACPAGWGSNEDQVVPPERVNDGYCDCPTTGADEPETNACSGGASWHGPASISTQPDTK
jgi:hypothetical protein